MRLLSITVASATALAITFSQTPQVLAQGHDDGAVGPTLRLDGGPSLGSDTRGIGARSEGTQPSIGTKPEKNQTGNEKTGEATIRGRSHTHIGWSPRMRHHFVIRQRGHIFALHMPRHRFVIHRHGRRFVTL